MESEKDKSPSARGEADDWEEEITMETEQNRKSKVVAVLLAFFLGQTGAHRYYLGYKKQGVVQTCGLSLKICVNAQSGAKWK